MTGAKVTYLSSSAMMFIEHYRFMINIILSQNV